MTKHLLPFNGPGGWKGWAWGPFVSSLVVSRFPIERLIYLMLMQVNRGSIEQPYTNGPRHGRVGWEGAGELTHSTNHTALALVGWLGRAWENLSGHLSIKSATDYEVDMTSSNLIDI